MREPAHRRRARGATRAARSAWRGSQARSRGYVHSTASGGRGHSGISKACHRPIAGSWIPACILCVPAPAGGCCMERQGQLCSRLLHNHPGAAPDEPIPGAECKFQLRFIAVLTVNQLLLASILQRCCGGHELSPSKSALHSVYGASCRSVSTQVPDRKGVLSCARESGARVRSGEELDATPAGAASPFRSDPFRGPTRASR